MWVRHARPEGQTLGVDGGYLASGLFMPRLFEIPAATPTAAAA